MSYIPNYQHDIFVSYAPVDNEPLMGVETGWVTTMLHDLKVLLDQKLGEQDAFSLWRDTLLEGYTAVISERAKQLDRAATLLLILSPAYLNSTPCLAELRTFLNRVGKNSGRVFVVEYDKIEPRPEELSDLPGYRFWVAGEKRQRTLKSHSDDRYEDRLLDLRDDLSKQLQYLKEQIQKADLRPRPDAIPSMDSIGVGKTIFLAEVPDDLVLRREEVKRYLESQEIRVLPEKLYYFPTAEALQQAIEADLKKAAVFVQLLSASLPQRPPGMSTPALQYDQAQSLGMQILQWRDRTLEINTVQDPALRALLTGRTVMATGILEFQQQILQFLKKLEANKNAPKKPLTENCSLIFVNAERQDMALAHKIEEILINHGLGCSLPLEIAENTDPETIRADLEENLLSCDAVMVIDDTNTSLLWVRKQLLHCKRISSKREQSFKAVVRCNNASTSKSPLNIHLPYLHIVDYFDPPPHPCLSKLREVLSK